MTSPLEALAALEQQKAITEQHSQREIELGQRMLQVLQTRGELLVAKWGLYGGTDGLIGSATPGKRITQSTLPVPIGDDSFVALRHPIDVLSQDKPAYAVELIKTSFHGQEYCVIEPEISNRHEPGSFMAEHLREQELRFTEDEVIAGFMKQNKWKNVTARLDIGAKDDSSPERLEAVTTLVDHIETSLEPLSEDWQRITSKLPYEPKLPNDWRMREGTNHIRDLDIDQARIII